MRPEWLDDLNLRLGLTPQIVLANAINETHLLASVKQPDTLGWRTTEQAVGQLLTAAGYGPIVIWSHEGGPYALTAGDTEATRIADEARGAGGGVDRSHGDPGSLLAALRVVASYTVPGQGAGSPLAALLVVGAERLAENADQAPLRQVFAAAQHLAGAATTRRGLDPERAPMYSSVIWLVSAEDDTPSWFRSARGVSVLTVPLPDVELRDRVAAKLLEKFADHRELSVAKRAERAGALSRLCSGMTQSEMYQVATFAQLRKLSSTEAEDAVRGVQTGLRTSPWRSDGMLHDLWDAEQRLTGPDTPVRGQEEAVDKTLDILSRAVVGLTDWSGEVETAKPRAVLFLAGPTGVGKTLLARQVARALFGRGDAMIRFDMSEYASSHNEARLIGSPPGYVGHHEGGQLTTAVRKSPCSLLLFDEIDKADPEILDKFLQILEDGRLTDGQGRTVHFGETLIIFTSNLGIYARPPRGQEISEEMRKPLVPLGSKYETVDTVVRGEITRFFTEGLRRPELLNRFGENIVVFNYLTPEAAREILHLELGNVVAAARARRGFRVEFDPQLVAALERLAVTEQYLAYGGRGVKNLIEGQMVNQLSRQLLRLPGGSRARVSGAPGKLTVTAG